MKSIKLIDKELLKAMNGEPSVVSLNLETLDGSHEWYVNWSRSFVDPLVKDVSMSERLIAGSEKNKDIKVYIYHAEPKGVQKGKSTKRPGILHIHGGGFVMGSAYMNEPFCKRLALDTDTVVVSVEYRLAPQTRFPGGLEDCYAALLWMKNNAVELGVDADRLAITGESAGGGLAAQLAFLVRDRKEVNVVLQYLTFPMLDNRTGDTIEPGEIFGEYVWTRDANRFGWTSLLGQDASVKKTPYPAVPAQIENLAGLAPAYIMCGAIDLLLSESLQYAQRLMAAGVPTGLKIYPGELHGFSYNPDLQASKEEYEQRKRVFKTAFEMM